MKKKIPTSTSEEQLIAYFCHELKDKEQQEVEEWLAASEQHRKIYRQICRTILWTRWSRKEQSINGQIALRRLKRKQYQPFFSGWRYVAALAILSLLVAGGLLWKQAVQPTTVNMAEVQPGSSKARLILSTGEQIDITRKKATVTEQNGSVLKWDTTGQIHYQHSGRTGEALIHNRIEIPRGGEFQITLSDGTRVWLNAETELKYPVAFVGEGREVMLKGEAYFEVAKNVSRPFVVKTEQLDIKVLGTSFNMKSYPSETQQVTLVQGKVEVRVGNYSRKLQPGEQLNYSSEGPEIRNVDVKAYTAWKDRRFVFNDDLLEEVIHKLGRWYDVEFFLRDAEVRKIRFTGNLPKYRNLDQVLNKLELTTHIRFVQDGRAIEVFAE